MHISRLVASIRQKPRSRFLTIYSNQPQVILKLALVETALGKKDQAVAFLQAGRQVLDASNYGLALALAGRPSDAIPVLEAAARQPGADATVRQNLALAHGLAGDWAEARTIAAQDVPGDKLDARVQQWMQLANPKNPADQVAALVGVTPSPMDRGEPVRLALRKGRPDGRSGGYRQGTTFAPDRCCQSAGPDCASTEIRRGCCGSVGCCS